MDKSLLSPHREDVGVTRDFSPSEVWLHVTIENGKKGPAINRAGRVGRTARMKRETRTEERDSNSAIAFRERFICVTTVGEGDRYGTSGACYILWKREGPAWRHLQGKKSRALNEELPCA